jgi:hypothetical protein
VAFDSKERYLALVDYILIFSAFFVGDHLLFGVMPSFILVWLAVVGWRLLNGPSYSVGELLAQIGTFFFCLPLYIRGVLASDLYYLFLLHAVFFVNSLPLIIRLLQSRSLGVVAIFSCVLFFAEGIYKWGERDGVFFGPNVLYRVYLLPLSMLAASCLISYESSRNFRVSGLVATLATALILVPIISTGSRGGLMVYAFIAFSLGATYMRGLEKRSCVLLSGGFFLAVVLLFNNWSELQFILGRTVDYRSVVEGDAVRFTLFLEGYDFIVSENGMALIFGLGNLNSYYPDSALYPHNLFIEIMVYHGAALLVFVVLQYMVSFVCSRSKGSRFASGWVLMLPVFLGAMMSGNLTDHAYLLSFPAAWYFVCMGCENVFYNGSAS